MKKLPNKMKKMNNINIMYVILIIIFFGFLRSLYSKIEKKYYENKENPREIIADLDLGPENTKIENIETTLIRAIPVLYQLKVKYKNNTTKIYNLVDDATFQKINDLVSQKYKDNMSTILPAVQEAEDHLGFTPLLKSLEFCVLILFGYYTLKMIRGTTEKLMDQFNEKHNKKPNITNQNTNQFTFKDVAGAEEEKEEMQELVDFLKNPKKYSDLGARIPKGVLLSGPPGTGKTLLAKALSGEANVPFFATSGSEFVEMFVGLGASRIRNLFQMAKKNAPCIIFIDEIETLARQRKMSYGNSEQEQTLNQLLIELDGYNQNTGVIVIAATNKPEFLDTAILRPGRFDRQFIINLPTVKEREAILKLHASNKKIDPEVNLEELAKQTPGFSGAQLEGILNESALLSARKGLKSIDKKIISEAVDRILIGPAKKSKKYSQKEKNWFLITKQVMLLSVLNCQKLKKYKK